MSPTPSRYGPDTIDERFAASDLDGGVWTGAYLPAWSSYAEAAASYALGPAGLRLSLPPDHPLWCPDRHSPPLRVSAVQTGTWSGPVGSERGQQRDGRVGLGCGIKQIRDPRLTAEFAADPRPVEITKPHVYAVDWRPDGVRFFLDGELVRTCAQATDYPMQLIVGLFDFPEQPDPDGCEPTEPALVEMGSRR